MLPRLNGGCNWIRRSACDGVTVARRLMFGAGTVHSAPATGCAPLATRRPLRTWSGVVGRPGAWSPRAAAPWLAASSPHATRRALSGSCRATAAAREASVTSDVASAPVVLYNTLSRKKEEFTPREGQGNKVSMYVCGVTVYDYSHIGHARAYVAFDVLFRVLRSSGLDVTYCRNFTDIDDKIIKRAQERGMDPGDLPQTYIDAFHQDMDALNCLRPQLEPRATQHVPDMVATIERIMEHGHAYAVDGDVYFDVKSLKGYGRLSGRREEDNMAGASQRVAADSSGKRSAADFALWKAAKPGEPTWDSPWGKGRPGWHIECSTMIRSMLGPVIDIHGGGMDLVFPHHENEIAQSQAAACECDKQHMPGGVDFARFWVHNGFVNVDAEKMSKSLGNFFTIRDVLEKYHPMALRWFLISTHYRQPVNYSSQALDDASCRLYYVYATLAECRQALQASEGAGEREMAGAGSDVGKGAGPGGELLREVEGALRNDLGTPEALASLSGPLKQINDLCQTKKGKKRADRVAVLASLHEGITRALDLMGIDTDSLEQSMDSIKRVCLARNGMTEQDVLRAIEERAEARKAKDFAKSDQVRDRLASVGIMLMDTPNGTTWQPGVMSGPASSDA